MRVIVPTVYRSPALVIAAAVLLCAWCNAAMGQTYRAARHGGNYMHNYYLPPAPSSTPWAPAWTPDGGEIVVAMSGSILVGRSGDRERARTDLQPEVPFLAPCVARRRVDHLYRGRRRKNDSTRGPQHRDGRIACAHR